MNGGCGIPLETAEKQLYRIRSEHMLPRPLGQKNLISPDSKSDATSQLKVVWIMGFRPEHVGSVRNQRFPFGVLQVGMRVCDFGITEHGLSCQDEFRGAAVVSVLKFFNLRRLRCGPTPSASIGESSTERCRLVESMGANQPKEC
jgi:hypothetical protein